MFICAAPQAAAMPRKIRMPCVCEQRSATRWHSAHGAAEAQALRVRYLYAPPTATPRDTRHRTTRHRLPPSNHHIARRRFVHAGSLRYLSLPHRPVLRRTLLFVVNMRGG